MIKVRNFNVAIRFLRCGLQEGFGAALPSFFLESIGFYDSVLMCKPKFGVFALYNHSVCNITNIAYSYKNGHVLIQR